LPADGIFTVVAWAARGAVNRFRIELTDPTGAAHPVAPDGFEYTVGVVQTNPPLTNSIGVGLAGDEMLWLVRKGTPLPAKARRRLLTTVPVRRGEGGGMIRIPLLEGEHTRPDRNRRIGVLTVAPAQVARDVPEGSEVQLRVEIDASRAVKASAYVPLLDEEFDHVVTLRREEVPTHEVLAAAVDAERRRLAEARGRQEIQGSVEAEAVLFRIDSERIEEEVAALVDAARADADAATTCGKRLLDLRAAVDAVEAALEWPELVTHGRALVEDGYRIAEAEGPDSMRRMAELANAVREAVDSDDARLLRLHVEEVRGFLLGVMARIGYLDQLTFEQLELARPEMTDQATAERLFAEGRAALGRRDLYTLRNVNARLRGLLPAPPPPPDPFSTVRRG
jgi:molecular chaperone DnaK